MTSGRSGCRRATASAPVAASPTTVMSGCRLEDRAEPGAQHRVIVDEEHADLRRSRGRPVTWAAAGVGRGASRRRSAGWPALGIRRRTGHELDGAARGRGALAHAELAESRAHGRHDRPEFTTSTSTAPRPSCACSYRIRTSASASGPACRRAFVSDSCAIRYRLTAVTRRHRHRFADHGVAGWAGRPPRMRRRVRRCRRWRRSMRRPRCRPERAACPAADGGRGSRRGPPSRCRRGSRWRPADPARSSAAPLPPARP